MDQKIKNSIFNCNICDVVVDEQTALLMPCLTTICKACAVGDVNKNVVCKTCGLTTCVEDIRPHFLVKPLELLKYLEEANNVDKCQGCSENYPGIAKCITCQGDLLCEICVDAHKRVRLTKDHVLEQYGVNKYQKDLIRSKVDVSEVNGFIDLVSQRVDKVTENQMKMKAELKQFSDDIRLALLQREERLQLEIDAVSSNHIRRYEALKAKLEQTKAFIEEFNNFAGCASECRNRALLMQAIGLIPNIIKEFAKIKDDEFASNSDVKEVKQIVFDGFVTLNGVKVYENSPCDHLQSTATSPIPFLLNCHSCKNEEKSSIVMSSAGQDKKRKFENGSNGHDYCKENLGETSKRICNGSYNPMSIFDITMTDDDESVTVVNISTESVVNGNNGCGCSDAKTEENKEWEEFCVVCQNDNGELLKCLGVGCTRVFHRHDHIPSFPKEYEFSKSVPFVCGFCRNFNNLRTAEDDIQKEKRKSDKMTPYERAAAERILLELYCHFDSDAFHEPVDKSYEAYHATIVRPMSFSDVRENLSNRKDGYKKMEPFIADINQIFRNCFMFYKEEQNETHQKAKTVGKLFRDLVEKFCDQYLHLVEISINGDYVPSRYLRNKRP